MGFAGLFRRLLTFLRPYRLESALLVAGLILDVGLDNGIRLSFKYLIDYALTPRNRTLLLVFVAAFIVVFLVRTAAGVGKDFLYSRISNGVLRDIRVRLFDRLSDVQLGFFRRNPAGDISSRFSTDLGAIENALVMAIPTAIYSVAGIVISLVSIFLLEWRLAFIGVVGLPLAVLLPKLLEKRALTASRELKDAQGGILNTIQENVLGQTLVRAFGLKDRKARSFEDDARKVYRIGFRASLFGLLMPRFSGVGVFLMQLGLMAIGAFMVLNDALSIGSLVSINLLFMALSGAVEELVQTAPLFVHAAAGMTRIDEILEEPTARDVSTRGLKPSEFSRGIVFEDVSFGYSSGQTILNHVNLTIPYRSSAAFVGASGSGKSTILNLMMRFYDPSDGKVTLEGYDLRDIDMDVLRKDVSVVLQDSFLFSASIRENISLARPEASDAEISAAARAAEIHDYIMTLSDGYRTMVGALGSPLSGGQRQRIAIARAIIRDPRIIIFDEPTSALDPTTEAAVSLALGRLSRGRTSIMVTHRLALAMNMDCIFVLDNGRIAESGSHGELLRANGLYRSMWEKQNGFVLSADGGNAEVNPEWLRRVPIFQNLGDEMLRQIKPLFVTERYNEDRVIMVEGEPGDRFYIIVRGTVEVLKGKENRRVAVLQDGDYFGEIALLRDTPRTATVRTRTPNTLLSLDRGQFAYLVSSVPGMRDRMEEVLGKRAAGD